MENPSLVVPLTENDTTRPEDSPREQQLIKTLSAFSQKNGTHPHNSEVSSVSEQNEVSKVCYQIILSVGILEWRLKAILMNKD